MENKDNVREKEDEEEKVGEKEYRRLQIRLEEHRKKKKQYFIPLAIVMVLMVLSVFFLSTRLAHMNYFIEMPYLGTMAIVLAIMAVLYTSLFFEIKERKIKNKMIAYELDNMLSEVEEDIFENSIKMSYQYLDQYYSQTKDQAKRGFGITVAVSVFGALLIGVGIVAMFMGKTEPSYVTCASGVMTEFISAVFFYLYNKTVTSMNNYHNKLVLSHNISIALKVSDSLPDADKTKAKDMIITELLKDINSYLIRSDEK